MSLAENFNRWKDEWRYEGVREGEERGRREGQQSGLNLGLRGAVRSALHVKFGDLGLRFWSDHLEKQDIAPWLEILNAIVLANSIDEMHRFRP